MSNTPKNVWQYSNWLCLGVLLACVQRCTLQIYQPCVRKGWEIGCCGVDEPAPKSLAGPLRLKQPSLVLLPIRPRDGCFPGSHDLPAASGNQSTGASVPAILCHWAPSDDVPSSSQFERSRFKILVSGELFPDSQLSGRRRTFLIDPRSFHVIQIPN